LIVANQRAAGAQAMAEEARQRFSRHGWQVVSLDEETGQETLDIALVLGGDGTLLRAAEAVRGRAVPLLGINLGHLGFLAECDLDGMAEAIDRVVAGDFTVEARSTLQVVVDQADGTRWAGWALNEVTLEKAEPQRMVEVLVSVDGQPISNYGCDGMVVATATGSTGHAFSGGGPVVWPDLDALLVVPLAAHALFNRPLLVTPHSTVRVHLRQDSRTAGLVSCDGRRTVDLAVGGQMVVTLGDEPVELVRFGQAPFAQRLVNKFTLPVGGWRGDQG
jgi:NAD+ kinase